MTAMACPFCGRNAKCDPYPGGGDGLVVTCGACGKFGVTGTALATVESLEPQLRSRVGFWTRDQIELGDLPIVGTDTFELVRSQPEKSVMDRAERLLHIGIRAQDGLGEFFSIRGGNIAGYTHSRNANEVAALAELLQEEGWLRFDNGNVTITAKGFIRASAKPLVPSSNGFIAMWFDPSMKAARLDGFEPAVSASGYSPVIVSNLENNNKIDDEIIAQIRQAKFLVADFTGHRGGVYFEAGFALGLGLPVFWTCRQDELTKLHFDVRQYNVIDWTDPSDLKVRLSRRIGAVIGMGPVRVKPSPN